MHTSLSRGKLTTDLVLAVVFGLCCLPFALLGNAADLVVLVGFVAALAIRRLSPAWSLGIAWAAAVLQMAALRDLQLYDTAVLGVLYSTAARERPDVMLMDCLLYTSPSPRDLSTSRMPSSA